MVIGGGGEGERVVIYSGLLSCTGVFVPVAARRCNEMRMRDAAAGPPPPPSPPPYTRLRIRNGKNALGPLRAYIRTTLLPNRLRAPFSNREPAARTYRVSRYYEFRANR